MDEDATYLRDQAEKCRRLAKSLSSQDVASTLLGMALDYEKRAEEIDERPPAGPS